MKIVLAGAFGNLGAEILKCLAAAGHEIVAADLKELPIAGCEGTYTFVAIDATKPNTRPMPIKHLSSSPACPFTI